jgi:hypothetical protein
MKNYYKLVLAILSFSAFGCSSDDESAEFAMSAKINGTSYRANSPSDNNLFSVDNLFDYYPVEDFVLLQSRSSALWGPEINLWLKRTDIAVGTYPVGKETFSTPPSHFIDLIDNSNEIIENTKSGTIVITEVNTNTKIVKGTFQFNTVQSLDDAAAPIDFTISNGTFKYKYE